ncbi:MAG: L,D-transpeptidase family protein [Eubacteriaceae bacterium]|nr:L,D-transpeptidase family protein [Eubacteriaceae bacterium]
MKKKVIIVVIVCVALFTAGSFLYMNSDGYEYKATHFAENTFIEGIDCSGLTGDEAKAKLTKEWNKKTFTITQDGKTVGSISNMECTYDIDEQIDELLDPNPIAMLKSHMTKSRKDLDLKMTPVMSEDTVKKIKAMSILNVDYKVKTKNAYVDMSNNKFKIVKEVQGDNIDKDVFVKTVKKDIAGDDFEMDYTASDYYEKPKIKSDDPNLLEEQEFDKKNYSQVITYNVYNGDYVVKPKDLARMMPADGSGGTKLDEDAVKKYVEKTLAWDVNTAYAPRKFKTASGKTITVEGGNYGYSINKKKETKALISELKSGKDVERKPYYSQEPYYKGGGMNDIGSSYIEINLSSQELWLFKNGKVKLNTAIVSGNSGNHDTPSGVYQIAYLQRNTTLKGNNDDGSSYNSKVSYWMPFNGGIGCHDASWRGSFGGSIYQSNGSHGCVNMPSGDAASLYYSIEKGFPVVVHY